MTAARSSKAMLWREESPDTEAELAAEAADRVLLASIDSFPASDPPGWIEVKARPHGDTAPSRQRR